MDRHDLIATIDLAAEMVRREHEAMVGATIRTLAAQIAVDGLGPAWRDETLAHAAQAFGLPLEQVRRVFFEVEMAHRKGTNG